MKNLIWVCTLLYQIQLPREIVMTIAIFQLIKDMFACIIFRFVKQNDLRTKRTPLSKHYACEEM